MIHGKLIGGRPRLVEVLYENVNKSSPRFGERCMVLGTNRDFSTTTVMYQDGCIDVVDIGCLNVVDTGCLRRLTLSPVMLDFPGSDWNHLCASEEEARFLKFVEEILKFVEEKAAEQRSAGGLIEMLRGMGLTPVVLGEEDEEPTGRAN